MRIGVIGTGNMGGMLARAFATNSTHDVYVYNRTRDKAERVKDGVSNIQVVESAERLVSICQMLFICTKAADGYLLMQELGALLSPQMTLVSTISTISLREMRTFTRARLAKAIPSIVQTVRSGVLLYSCHPDMTDADKAELESLFQEISFPFEVEESQVRVCSDLTSCGPAFLSFLLLQWAEIASQTGHIHRSEAEHLLAETLKGVSNLLGGGMTLRDILQRVAVPGGVTERGLDSLQQDAPDLFRNLHQSTAGHAHGDPMVNARAR